MGIEFILDSEVIDVDDKNFSESMRRLDSAMIQGTLMFVQNYSGNDLGHISVQKRSDCNLFFFDKKVNGNFTVKKGKENHPYIHSMDSNLEYFTIVNNFLSNELQGVKIILPRTWSRPQYNENTFSSAGGTSWNSKHAVGTQRIIVGNKLLEMFPQAINALKFAQDAKYFHLPSEYANQNRLITKAGDDSSRDVYDIRELKRDFNTLPDKINSQVDIEKYQDIRTRMNINQQSLRTDESQELACVRAVLNLLSEPMQKCMNHDSGLEAVQLGWYGYGAKIWQNAGYPVDNKDYLIKEILHPKRDVAFVKVGQGLQFGDIYILPATGMTFVINKALSIDNVRKYYPRELEMK